MRWTAFALAALGAVPAAGASDPREFRHQRLSVPEAHHPPSSLGPRGAELRAELASMGLPPEAGFYDVQAGRWGSLLPREPLLPGSGVDNALSWPDLGIAGRPTQAQIESAAFAALLQYLGRAKALRIDRAELGPPRVTVHEDGQLVQLWIPRTFGGVPVRDSALGAVIGHGNLVLLGFSHWADAPAPARPAVDAGRARRAAAAHAGAGWRAHGTPRLEYVPFADPPHAETYDFRLAWVVEGRIAGSVGTWEALVDSGTGELLAFEDRNQYAAPRRLVGGVYPLSNDGAPPDGVEQPGYPMPFADLRLPDGSTVFTNSSGLACVPTSLPGPPGPGTVETRLSGRYVRIADGCGPVAESFRIRSRLPADLGASSGTDCAVPPGHSAGDTHAARTAFYELNRINEQARGYLPANGWLQMPLLANTNSNLGTCGATWSGTAVTFYRGGVCGNPGEIASVVSHEWGHGMDDNNADPTISNPAEAVADIHAILRHNNSCVGRGFRPQGGQCPGYGDACTACTGVRDTDWARHQSGLPHDIAWVQTRCPSGTSICGRLTHCAGVIVAEAVWDLHARDLPSQFGLDANSALEVATRLMYVGGGLVGTWYQCTPPNGGCGALGGYMMFLAADDDNGNLLDGTPHMTAIHAAFNRHQIACATPPPVNSGCVGGPAAPPTLSVTPQMGAVTLSWTAVPGATRYEVYRADGVRGCAIGKVQLGETTGTGFTDAGLLDGFSYHYAVLPANGSCYGPMSACETAVSIGPGICQP